MLAVTSAFSGACMRILTPLIVLALLGLGFTFGALNPTPVGVDLFGLSFTIRIGLALLLAALGGALGAGVLLGVLVIWPLRRRLRRQQRALERPVAADASSESVDA
jgi:uncharacterized integral membrane protein